MMTEDTLELLSEMEGLVADLRAGYMITVSDVTKEIMMAENWSNEDMQMLKLVREELDAVDLRLNIYAEWLREKLEEDVTEEEEQ